MVFDQSVDFRDSKNNMPNNFLSMASMVKTCNTFGLKVVDLYQSLDIRFVNGTIDYVLERESRFTLITDFAVLNCNQQSDHAPLNFVVKGYNSLSSKCEYNDTKYR